jgi:uncharacterized delta-60 repeat protein
MKNLIWVLFISIVSGSMAQNYRADLTFNTGTGFVDQVNTITIQSDGKVLVGGSFNNYNGVQVNCITRLNPDGTRDLTFNTGTGFDYQVNTITLQSDGKILVGGLFQSYNGTSQNNLTRLNTDGSIDLTFNTGTGFDYQVNTITLQSDGKILVGGKFQSYNGTSQNDLTRLNTDGSIDLTFNIGTGFNSVLDQVNTITLQSDGKVLVGGWFLNYNGSPAKWLIRLNPDGTRDLTFNTGTGFDNQVNTITLQSDGKILVGGSFPIYNGVQVNCITRLNPDGTRDLTFNTGTGFDDPVNTITIQSDGKVLVGGSFNNYNGSPVNGLIRLNPDGTRDLTFNTGTGISGTVFTTEYLSDGRIVVGGTFPEYNGFSTYNIVRLRPCTNTPINQIIDETSCGVYTSSTGQTYTQSGTYVEVIPNTLGCDSIIRTINLTIINYNYIGNTIQIQESNCQPNPSGEISVSIQTNRTLFISEYYSGPGSDKWIELYNASDNSINLNNLGPVTGQWSLVVNNESYVFPENTLIQACSTIRVSNPNASSLSNYSSNLINGNLIYLNFRPDVFDDFLAIDLTYPISDSTLIRSAGVSVGNINFTSSEWSTLSLNLSSPNTHQCNSCTTPNPDFSVIWSNSQIGNSISNLSSGSYSFDIIHTPSGCLLTQDTVFLPSIQNDNITISPNPAFGNAPLNVAFANQTANLSNYNFTWYFGDGTSQQSNAPFLSHIYTQDGYADVTVVAENLTTGCSSSETFNDMIFVIGGVTCTHTATINQSGPLTGCVGDSILLSSNTDPTFTYQWNRNGIPVSGATSSSFYPTQSGSYTVTIYQNNCPVTSGGITVAFNALPAVPTITSNGTITPCSGGSMTLTAPGGLSTYLWNTGATTNSINVSQSGNYFVTVTNSFGCERTSNLFPVNASNMASPQVCIVGMDSLTNENRIVWEKPLTSGIDSFYVYKESNVSNVYTKIGATDYNDLAVFLDVNSNPAVQAYRYKISALDTCGVETNVGDFHKTIHLTINQGVGGAWNLIWSHYEGLNFGSYNIYRGTDPSNISLLTTIQSNLNSYTDLTPPSGAVYYQIEVVNPVNCDPTKIVNYGVSRSNIVNNGVSGVIEVVNTNILVYPNPTNGNITLEASSELVGKRYSIRDFSGRIILDGKISSTQEQIELQDVARGAYYLSIENGSSVTKLIKQ